LTFRPKRLKFAPLVALVHHYVSTKLEASTTLPFPENRRHGMDRWKGATFNVTPSPSPWRAAWHNNQNEQSPMFDTNV